MTATVWTRPLCSYCAEEKALLKAEGYTIDAIEVDAPEDMDRDAYAQLQLQDGMFPVVRVGGGFRIPMAVTKAMSWS